MSQGHFGTFIVVINYINKKWETCHITIGVFEVHETLRATMVMHLKDLLAWLSCWIAYIKNEGANLNIVIMALMNIVSYIPL
jgi:hypothetical protein